MDGPGDVPVSPGFRLRPSLSVAASLDGHPGVRRVAGVQTPAFVERAPAHGWTGRQRAVSPGFRLRPSLSGHDGHDVHVLPEVSPGFRLRPSLSVVWGAFLSLSLKEVSPGFRLRPSLSVLAPELVVGETGGVAGVQTPAFVERSRRCSPTIPPGSVSPGFRLRPSLSGLHRLWPTAHRRAVSPGFRLRPSLSAKDGMHAPHVEGLCRRGSDSGLR